VASDRDELYRLIVESAHEGIWVADADGRTTYVNGRMAEMLDRTYSEMIGRSIYDFIAPPQIDEVHREFDLLKERSRDQYEVTLLKSDGEEIIALVNASPLHDASGAFVGGLAMVVDITARKRLEQQIALSERLESVGRLASGVAHDFKNLLTAILGFCELAEGKLPAGHPAHDDLKEVREAGERAVSLTLKLLAFGRRQVLAPAVVDVNDVVASLLRVVPGIVWHSIVVSTDLAADLRPALVDPAQLEQALLNLVVNARDAMPSDGVLRISTSNTMLLEPPAPGVYEFTPGDYVDVSVQDTGVGMDEETQVQIFEPFFTTKRRGSGLGLASVYGFVKQSKGFITVRSTPGEGSTITIYLPAAVLAQPRARPSAHHADEISTPSQG
jgi:PAS domain S-box-containing protein